MLLISIIALVIIAGAVFYLHKSSKTIEVVLENKDLTDDVVEATASVAKSIKQVEKMAAKIDEALASAPEKPSKKVKEEIAEVEPVVAPVVEAAPVVEVAPAVESAPVVEAPKPAKKKRRYYPKKK